MKKVALITGASSDIGSRLTQALLKDGFSIAAHSNRPSEFLAGLAGANLAHFQADLTDFAQAEKLVRSAQDKFGALDVLINVIGPFANEDILSVTPERWRNMVELNLNVAFTMTYYAKDLIVKLKGHIINFGYAGVESIRAWTDAAPYAAAKAGLAVLTKSLATALAPSGVRVNAICPGYLDLDHFTSEERKALVSKIPAGRLGKLDEVVAIAQWLIQDCPSYVTGALIPVGGAWEHSA